MHWRGQESISQDQKDERGAFGNESQIGRNDEEMLTVQKTESHLNNKPAKTSNFFDEFRSKGTFLASQERK